MSRGREATDGAIGCGCWIITFFTLIAAFGMLVVVLNWAIAQWN